MYVLLATAVGCVGASAGELFFNGDGTLSTPFDGAQNRCLLRYPLASHLQQLDRCQEGSYRSQGLFVLGCAVGMLVLTATLMVIVPWLDRRRLARTRQFAEIEGVTAAMTARFGELCDQVGLTGRRRPRLVVAAVPEAFTIALPGGRPLVVLPVTVALAWDQTGRFDPIVLHELAHVRARDVSLVSSVRGIAWVTIPAIAVASLPEFLAAGQTQVQQAYLIQAAVFVTATILVAAGLLRVREIAADRQATRWLDSPETLQDLLDTAGKPAGTGLRRQWQRLLTRHPSLPARRRALQNPLLTQEAAFATALTVGAVAAMAMNTCFYFASSLHSSTAGWLPTRVWAATGGIVLGLGFAPAFLRSAAQGRRADAPVTWWISVAGVSTGLLLGSLVAPGLATGAVVSVVIGSGFGDLDMVVVLACTGAGMAALTAGLASLAADRYPNRPSWLTAALTAVSASCTAAALLPVRSMFSATADLHVLAFSLAGNQWRLLLLLYPAAVIALAVPIRSRKVHGDAVRAFVSAALIPVGAAVIGTAVFLSQQHPSASQGSGVLFRWIQEDGWACAFTGCVVLIVLALARGIPGLARATLSAWLTTLLVYAGSIGYEDLFRGHPFRPLSSWAIAPSVWLFYLALPTSLLALVRVRRPAALRQGWLLPAGASAGAAAVAALVLVTGVSALVESSAPQPPFPDAPCGRLGTVATTSRSFLALDANQVMTSAAAGKVIDGVCAALPGGWIKIAPTPASSVRDTVRPADCMQLDAQLFLRALGRPLAQAQGHFQIATGSIAGSENLSVVVNSLARPVPSSLFAAADKALAPCHRFIDAERNITAAVTADGFTVPETGTRTWGFDFSESLRARGKFAGESTTWVMASIGRDLIIVSQRTITLGIQPPPDYAVTAAALTATVAAFRQSALSVAQACPKFRIATATLGHQIVSAGDNGYNSTQRADFRAYAATVAQLGELVGRSGSNAGLVRDLELTGAASDVVGLTPTPDAEEVAALTEVTKLYPQVRKACLSIGSWPK
jgi:Zn-dependent protease with chaperone function